MRRADLAIVGIFLAVILLPGLGLVLGWDPQTVSESERRELAPFPVWATEPSVERWVESFQRYFADHFSFRRRLIDWHAALLWYGLHTSASKSAIPGKGDWMFYADDGGLEDYVESRPFTAAELEAWRLTLERTHAWLKARGIRFLFVVAPDKQMIYGEEMPASLRRLRDDYRADQLMAVLRGSTVPVLDLRPALVAAKGGEILYHRYDTHWNDRGALVGEARIALELQKWFPTIRPLRRTDFVAVLGLPSGDRASLLALFDREKQAMAGLRPRRGWSWHVLEPAVPDPFGEDGRVVTEIPGSPLPRALVFRDSFASRLIPYLSEHFSRAVYLWQKGVDAGSVLRERPDVVIQEIVGRHLVTDTPYPDALPAPGDASG